MEDFEGFAKRACTSPNCENKLEDYGLHDKCVIHRKCFSRLSLSYTPDNCDTCQSLLTEQEGIGNGSLSNSPSSHLPWLPSINEMNQSPSSIYCLNTSQLSGMSPHELQATLEQYQRKLAFHEPRPCPTCSRMYRDAATLRTHIAIMHSEGREPYTCTCGSVFRTKYDMYQHRKNGHR